MAGTISIFVIILASVFTCLAQSTPVIVVTKQAYIREEPSQKSKVVATVPKGTRLASSANSGNWSYVTKTGIRGWIHHTVITNYAVKSMEKHPNIQPAGNGDSDFNPDLAAQEFLEHQWEYYATENDGTRRYYNLGFRPDKIVHIWSKAVSSDKRETRELFEFRCGSDEYRILSVVDYDSDGNVSDATDHPSREFTYVVPESVGQQLYNVACRRWLARP